MRRSMSGAGSALAKEFRVECTAQRKAETRQIAAEKEQLRLTISSAFYTVLHWNEFLPREERRIFSCLPNQWRRTQGSDFGVQWRGIFSPAFAGLGNRRAALADCSPLDEARASSDMRWACWCVHKQNWTSARATCSRDSGAIGMRQTTIL